MEAREHEWQAFDLLETEFSQSAMLLADSDTSL
jgi:hypothetical protein